MGLADQGVEVFLSLATVFRYPWFHTDNHPGRVPQYGDDFRFSGGAGILISLAMSLPADAAGLEVREPSRMVVASSGVDVPDAFCKGLALAPKQVRVFFGVPMW